MKIEISTNKLQKMSKLDLAALIKENAKLLGIDISGEATWLNDVDLVLKTEIIDFVSSSMKEK